MIRVSFVALSDGREYQAQARPGQNLMEVALEHKIPGIAGECGGVCACATCHIYLEAAALGLAGAMGFAEEDMLSLLGNRRAVSRLACQIPVTSQLDGIKVYIP